MNEATIMFNTEVTVIAKGQSELPPNEKIIENLTKYIKETCGLDDVHIKNFKVFLTSCSGD